MVCQDDLEVGNATTEKSGSVWLVGRINTVTCFSEHRFLSINDATKEVECQFEGWEETEGCLKVCFEAPDLTEYKALWNDSIPPGRLHDEISINCRSSHYHNESLDNTTIPAVCTPDGWQATYPCILCE
ncbi:hypothetical protein E2C01_018163 [Portunus trituberculatus]|uniref:Sushi domain-containing protein n=1 Tax=Portunus trituberculatus TaxID=210409 RepID=A0A5B7DW22_PORTR|nr:hypothetical protein [Portunus trituberculatus]